jgi:branched-chain amino acid transport system permease protein
MELLLQRVADGLTNGSVYAALAIALVIVHRSTKVVNFAQGEMAMVSTFVTYVLAVEQGWPIWPALGASIVLSMFAGASIERLLIRPVEQRSPIAPVVVPIGLFVGLNALAGRVWGYDPVYFPSLFPSGLDDYVTILGARVRYEAICTWVTIGLLLVGLRLVLTRTRMGLAFRGLTSNRESAELVGVDTGRTLMTGWALAAGIGALAGALVAPTTLLQPNMMLGVLIYALAASVLGGFDSPGGAALGGVVLGLIESVVVGYVPFIGSDLKLATALVVIIAVLLVRPQGLFGTRQVVRA